MLGVIPGNGLNPLTEVPLIVPAVLVLLKELWLPLM